MARRSPVLEDVLLHVSILLQNLWNCEDENFTNLSRSAVDPLLDVQKAKMTLQIVDRVLSSLDHRPAGNVSTQQRDSKSGCKQFHRIHYTG